MAVWLCLIQLQEHLVKTVVLCSHYNARLGNLGLFQEHLIDVCTVVFMHLVIVNTKLSLEFFWWLGSITINYIQKINAKVLVNSAAQLKGWEPGAEWEGKGWRWGHVDSETLRAKRQRSVGEDDEERASLGKKTDLGSRFKRWTILQAFSFVTLQA